MGFTQVFTTLLLFEINVKEAILPKQIQSVVSIHPVINQISCKFPFVPKTSSSNSIALVEIWSKSDHYNLRKLLRSMDIETSLDEHPIKTIVIMH